MLFCVLVAIIDLYNKTSRIKVTRSFLILKVLETRTGPQTSRFDGYKDKKPSSQFNPNLVLSNKQ